ncbi:hypothetical protein ONE63_005136 [Megalurothrips usitatus]|uniref:Uncharacterized protein n=1 Tax=Megalurothrips usitatus TaxID=439358 RepID=A0AAV7XV17_9NEOP|nr:hypothetical protein ONE63_005136 [Megalurothrips usitatus]
MGVHLDLSCIDRSHRVGRMGPHPRAIIVKFTSYAHRSLMFRAKRLLKGKKVTVREDLTGQRLRLMKNAISEYGERNVWSIDGVILINVGERFTARVRSDSDLDDVIVKYPPPRQ